MPGQSFQPSGHINQPPDAFLAFVFCTQLRIFFERLVYRNAKLVWDAFCNSVHKRVRQIHHAPDVPDNASCRQRTKRNNLRHTFLAVFFDDIVNYFLTSFKTKIHVNIRHGNTLRI